MRSALFLVLGVGMQTALGQPREAVLQANAGSTKMTVDQAVALTDELQSRTRGEAHVPPSSRWTIRRLRARHINFP
jgi:hypothetical protein